jgi:hypothetical protein
VSHGRPAIREVRHPLAPSASLTFEQSGGWVEGDGASAAADARRKAARFIPSGVGRAVP